MVCEGDPAQNYAALVAAQGGWQGTGMAQTRFIPTEGIHNFRDYGGYPTVGGGRVGKGQLYRSGQHFAASDTDLAAVDALEIATIIDLRGNPERASHPCRRPEDFSASVVFYDGTTSNAPPHMDIGDEGVTEENAIARMRAIYRRMPHNPAMHWIFREYFRVLDENEGASLVHCFAGKDRTGIAVALLQHVLGVHHDDIVAEFLLTNEAPTFEVLRSQSVPRLEQRYGSVDEGAVDALLKVREEYIESFLRECSDSHGSLDAFLEGTLGVDGTCKERLRARYVE